MSTISVRSLEPFKSLKNVYWKDIPAFAVVTGLNGSGKTHLLELIAATLGYNVDKRVHGGYNKPAEIRGLALASADVLYVTAAKNIDFKVSASLRDLEEQINTLYKRPVTSPKGSWKSSSTLYGDFRETKGPGGEIHYDSPPIAEFRKRLTPSIIANGSLAGQNPNLALLFLSYAVFKAEARYRNMSDAQIVEQFGVAPWDLLNQMFEVAGLPFLAEEPEAPTPSVFSMTIDYELRLKDTAKQMAISPNDLSAGEKVIVAMVFLHYTSHHGNSKYKLLLLDEPDVHLHPSFVKKYVTILKDVLIDKTGARVIMTTHSPVTVALVPEASVHILDRASGDTPMQVSRARALETLLDGVPALGVRYEERRPIFVEHRNDVGYYEGLVSALRNSSEFFYEPYFLAPHSGTSNCTDVIDIVKKLTAAGAEPVYGIIDHDLANKPGTIKFIEVLGDGKRYAIENYLLDPIFVALALIKINKMRFADFGIYGEQSYVRGLSLTEAEVQAIVDHVLGKLALTGGPTTQARLINGYTITYPNAFLYFHGHKYETNLVREFPQLLALSKGHGDDALKKEMLPVINDYARFLAVELCSVCWRRL
jgi:predicted ATPase